MQEGLILKGIGGFYYIKSGSKVYECKPRGIFRKERISPAVGDRVEISVVNEKLQKGIIEKIIKRKILLNRPPVANVEQAILVFSVKSPEPDFLLLDKMLAKISSLEIETVICINKVDLDKSHDLINHFKAYSLAGYNVIFMSAFQGEGIQELKAVLRGKLSILAGASGVGKSTIINRLYPENKVETGSLSKKIERGRHTTRHVELFEVEDNAYIADTPGFSMLNIDDIKSESLKGYYPEFNEYLNNCKFSGCNHIAEPSCAVKQAVEDGLINTNRYERYKQLFGYLKQGEKYRV